MTKTASGGIAVLTLLFLAIAAIGACNGRPVETVAVAVSPGDGAATSGGYESVIARGRELYAANCQLCHGDREGNGATLGAPPQNGNGHTWHHPDAQLKEMVFNGAPFFGVMPPFQDKLTEQEVDAILAYIKTWWSDDQRRDQADISHRYQDALEKQDKQKQGL